MPILIYLCLYSYTYLCLYSYTYAYTHIPIYAYTHIPMPILIYLSMPKLIYQCLYSYTYTYTYIAMPILIYLCLYSYIYAYTHIPMPILIYLCLYSYTYLCLYSYTYDNNHSIHDTIDCPACSFTLSHRIFTCLFIDSSSSFCRLLYYNNFNASVLFIPLIFLFEIHVSFSSLCLALQLTGLQSSHLLKTTCS